jgi:hypothetical protein
VRRSAPVDAAKDRAQDIKAQLMQDGGALSSAIASGLTYGDDAARAATNEEAVRIAAAREAARHDPDLAELHTEADQTFDAQAELESLREDKAVQEFFDATLEGADEMQALVQLKDAVSPDRFIDVLAQHVGFDPDDDYTREETGQALWELYDAVENRQASLTLAAQQLYAAGLARQIEQLSEIAIQETLNDWAQSNGLTSEEATARWNASKAFVAAQEGVDVERVMAHDMQTGLDLFLAADAALMEHERAQRIAAIQRSVIEADSTDVGAGLTQMTAYGHQPVQPRADIRPKYDPERVAASAISRPATVADLKAQLLDDEPGTAEYKQLQKRAGEMFARARSGEARS